MGKKQPINVQNWNTTGLTERVVGPNRLKIGQIREFVDRLRGLPAGAALPDWSSLSMGERFAIALRLVPEARREAELEKSRKQLDRYAAGAEIPTMVLAKLAALTELPLDWIITGRAMSRKAPLVYGTAEQLLQADVDVPLQKLAFKPSAGRGQIALDDEATYVRFPRAIIDHIGIKAVNARLAEFSGMSMYPTINDGDVGVVDVSATDIVEGKVYVFSIGDEVFVKRLRRVGGKVFMLSDNRDLFPDEEPIPEGLPFRVFAQVKWSGRSL